jgi:hypothetical protein
MTIITSLRFLYIFGGSGLLCGSQCLFCSVTTDYGLMMAFSQILFGQYHIRDIFG